MLELIILCTLIVQILNISKTQSGKFRKFLFWSLFFNIFIYLVIAFEIHQYIRMVFGGIKLMGYITLAAVFLIYTYQAVRNLSKPNLLIFAASLFFWVLKIAFEYASWYKIIDLGNNQLVEDLLLFTGLFIWMLLFLKLFMEEKRTTMVKV